MTARKIALWTAIAAGLVSAGVIVHEWNYRTDHPHALGPSSELIALGVVGLLASIAVIALTKATDEEQAETRRRSREQFGSLTELREELSGTVERLHEEVLDERVLQFLLHDKTDPDAWGKWEVLVDESRAEREVYDVGVGASG